MALDPEQIHVARLTAALAPWEEHEALVRDRFGTLAPAVVDHAKSGYPDPETLRGRLIALTDQWPEIMDDLSAPLRSPDAIEAELASARGPVRYKDLGITPERAFRATAHSRDIRSRYRILDLAWELGYLDDWTTEAVERYYE